MVVEYETRSGETGSQQQTEENDTGIVTARYINRYIYREIVVEYKTRSGETGQQTINGQGYVFTRGSRPSISGL